MRREEEEEEVSFIGHEKSLGGILMGGREGSAHSSRRHLGRDADTEHHTTVVCKFDVRIRCSPFLAVQNVQNGESEQEPLKILRQKFNLGLGVKQTMLAVADDTRRETDDDF